MENLVFQGATYASMTIITNKELNLYKSTNMVWDEFYHGNNFAKYCHLISVGNKLFEKNDNFTLLWDHVTPDTEISNIINEHRIKNNLCHGISFVQKNIDGSMQGINLATKFGDLSFTLAVIENKAKIFNEFKKIKILNDEYNKKSK